MKTVSVFDGLACLRIALERAGCTVEKYYASEIKEKAIQVAKHNYPDIIHIGDIRNIKGSDIGFVDLFAGGSPCQDLSRANKEITGLAGEKSSLFYHYYRLYTELKAINPDLKFLLENVTMSDKDMNIISDHMSCLPIRINSALVSAQLRDRLYWTDIGPADYDLFGRRICKIPQPKDKGISLQSILTEGYTERQKSRALLESDCKTSSVQSKMWHRYKVSGFNTVVFNSPFRHRQFGIRWLNQTERERLQTVPEGYTSCVNKNVAAGLLGDAWTVDVIVHILQYLKKD